MVCLAVFLIAARGFCFTAEVLSLSNQEYFPAAQKAISEAKKSIFVVMYLISRELITKSRNYAFVVFKGFDLSVIEMIAGFINIYGAAKVDEAFKVVEKKNPDNPKRTFGYVSGILGKMQGNQ